MAQQPPYDATLTAPFSSNLKTLPDIPILVIFAAFFVVTTLFYAFRLTRQLRKRERYGISLFLFLFALQRVPTYVLLVVGNFQSSEVAIAVAAGTLIEVGIVLLYLANLVYVAAVIRAGTGQHTWLKILQVALYITTVLAVVMAIVGVVVVIFTADEEVLENCLYVRRAVAMFFLTLAIAPLGLLVAAYFGHRKRLFRVVRETWVDLAITAVAALLCMLVSGFRTGVIWQAPGFGPDLTWYQSRASFYALQMAPEILLMIMYMLVRVDKRFHELGETQEERQMVHHQPRIEIYSPEMPDTMNGSKETARYYERTASRTPPPLLPEICYS